jgi:hypothetical protein
LRIFLPILVFVLDVQPQPSSKLQDFNPRHYEPASFLDRGVALPFTTPLLFGARARAASDHSGLEVIIANPSGGKGVYILPWGAIPQICVPTLHDRRLWRLLRDKKLLTPLMMAKRSHGGRGRPSGTKDAGKKHQFCPAASPH